MKKLDNFINKIGIDKVLHFCVGAIIAFCISNVFMLREGIVGVDNIWFAIIGIIAAMIFEFIKEFILDSTPDKKDILATFLGSVFVFIVNIIGVLFYIWSN